MTHSQDQDPAPSGKPAPRLSITFFPNQFAWVQRQADLLDCSTGEVVRRLVEERQGVDLTEPLPPAPLEAPQPEEEAPDPEPPLPAEPASLPLAVERLHAVPLAAAHIGVPLDLVEEWLREDPALSRAVDQARRRFELGIEQRVLQIGTGERRGTRQALLAFLEANDPRYGRVKSELVQRITKPWIAKVLTALQDAVGVSTDIGRQVLRTFSERMGQLENDLLGEFT